MGRRATIPPSPGGLPGEGQRDACGGSEAAMPALRGLDRGAVPGPGLPEPTATGRRSRARLPAHGRSDPARCARPTRGGRGPSTRPRRQGEGESMIPASRHWWGVIEDSDGPSMYQPVEAWTEDGQPVMPDRQRLRLVEEVVNASGPRRSWWLRYLGPQPEGS